MLDLALGKGQMKWLGNTGFTQFKVSHNLLTLGLAECTWYMLIHDWLNPYIVDSHILLMHMLDTMQTKMNKVSSQQGCF